MSHWASRKLNIHGMIELVKAVIYPMINYWMRFCQFPIVVINRLYSIGGNFSFKSKTHKMSWELAHKTKAEGVVGIKRLDDVAKAAAMKLVWKILQKNSLWAKWMYSTYGANNFFWIILKDNNASNTWKIILKARQWCKGLIDRNIMNGESTSLWYDPWLNGSSLIDKLGWQYIAMNGGPNNQVSHLIIDNNWKNKLNCLPTTVAQNIQNIKIQHSNDDGFWFWLPSASVCFDFKTAWNQIRIKSAEQNWCKFIWSKYFTPALRCLYVLCWID